MTKAEERAREKYPEKILPFPIVYEEDTFDMNAFARSIFEEGYEQAEKDLGLTWKDIKKISRILDIMVDDDFKGEIPEEWEE